MEFIIEILFRTLIEAFYLVGIVIIIGLILGVLRNSTIRNFQRSFGVKAVMITGFIGVPIHEISHWLAALLFGHKVTEVKLLQRPDENGVMGYVRHSYNRNSIYQQVGNFFIGIAPIFGGALSIIAIMRLVSIEAYNKLVNILVGSLYITSINKNTVEGILNSYLGLLKVIFSMDNFKNPYFYLFLFIAICISSHISLSTADIKGASRGLGVIFILVLIVNALDLSYFISPIDLIRYNVLITGFLITAVILSIISYLISLIFRIVRLG
ncbi:MAG: hypothetical protein AB6733_11800 [Clostridiaceae bacterium]